ncbi:hypothetical protein ACFL5O_04690 [Myxococcota bacterium]
MQTVRSRVVSLGAFSLVAASLLISQVALSRLFSATVGYYYAFMLVSLAMLGLGSGGLIVQQVAGFSAPERMARQAAVLCLLMGLSAWAGTLGTLHVYPQLKRSESIGTLGALFWCLFPCFLTGGMIVALVLRHARRFFHVFYAVDLMSAAVGCVVALLGLSYLSPVLIMLGFVTVMPLVAGLLFALLARSRWLTVGCAMASTVGLVSAVVVSHHPHLTHPRHLQWLEHEPLLSRWNAFSNVSVYQGRFFTWSLSETYSGPRHAMRDLLIDGVGGTEIVRFNGQPESLATYEYLDYDMTALGQRLADSTRRQLIIGPGGGVDILQAYRRGRRDITVVEINPLVAEVVNQSLGDFSGRPYHLPGVKVQLENGRTFIERSTEAWGLIALTWVDTGGSATAMAFSENFLYTVDAYRRFLEHLEPDGFLAFMRALGPGERIRVDGIRGISVVHAALSELGVGDPSQHVIVLGAVSPYFFHRPMCYVLVKRSPFTPIEIGQARRFAEQLRFQVLWLPQGAPAPNTMGAPYSEVVGTIHDIMQARDRARLVRESSFDIMPTTDDNPFYFAERAGARRPAGEAVAQLSRYLWVLLALLVPFLGVPVLPLVRKTQRLGWSGASAIAYFCLLGVAFMLVEVEFFHVFSLVLGSPVYAIGVVLASLLAFSGLGSLLGRRLAEASRRWLAMAFAFLVLALGLFALTRPAWLPVLVAAPFWLRIEKKRQGLRLDVRKERKLFDMKARRELT